jgi:ABC-type phosphate/phosphonate transport system substrate-binding protein
MFKPLLLSFVFVLLGCKNTPLSSCILMKEMGSKKYPFKIAFVSEDKSASGLNLVQNERPSFANLKSCLEREAGISVLFEAVESESAILTGLDSNEFHFAVLNSLSFALSKNFQLERIALVSRPEQERLSRSVILGLSERWKTSFEIFNSEKMKMGYESPQSDFGFLIPRHLMMTQRFFPEESLFAWTSSALIEELDKKTVDAVAVSSDFLFENYEESLGDKSFVSLAPGMRFDRFIVFLVSPTLPRKSLVVNSKVLPKIVLRVQEVLPRCLLDIPVAFGEKVFGSQSMSPVRVSDFEFIEDISNNLKNFPQLNPFYGHKD